MFDAFRREHLWRHLLVWTEVTLAVQAFHQASATVLTESLKDARHHFRFLLANCGKLTSALLGTAHPTF